MSKTIVEMKNTRCEIRSSTSWRMMLAMTREKNSVKAFTTPWISVMVTMSPFWMCETSWAGGFGFFSTHRAQSPSRRDEAAALLEPVANALTSGGS